MGSAEQQAEAGVPNACRPDLQPRTNVGAPAWAGSQAPRGKPGCQSVPGLLVAEWGFGEPCPSLVGSSVPGSMALSLPCTYKKPNITI